MKLKNKNSDKEFSLLNVIAKEKYLLAFVLIVSILFTVTLHYKESSKFQEISTKAFIELPNSSNELFLLSNELTNSYGNKSFNNDFKYFKNKFSYKLSSLDNLLDFLSQEKNLKHLKNFSKNNLNPDQFLKINYTVSKDPEFDADFLITILMIHPKDFDAKFFLNDYFKFVNSETMSEFINSKLKLSYNILEILYKKEEIRKDIENNKMKKLEIETLDDNEILNLFNLYKGVLSKSDVSLFSLDASLDEINMHISLVKKLTDSIRKISFEPNFEIQSDLYLRQNYLIRNLALSFLISFVIFFSIISFKQVFKKLLI
jgi:hypothetical protein